MEIYDPDREYSYLSLGFGADPIDDPINIYYTEPYAVANDVGQDKEITYVVYLVEYTSEMDSLELCIDGTFQFQI